METFLHILIASVSIYLFIVAVELVRHQAWVRRIIGYREDPEKYAEGYARLYITLGLSFDNDDSIVDVIHPFLVTNAKIGLIITYVFNALAWPYYLLYCREALFSRSNEISLNLVFIFFFNVMDLLTRVSGFYSIINYYYLEAFHTIASFFGVGCFRDARDYWEKAMTIYLALPRTRRNVLNVQPIKTLTYRRPTVVNKEL